MEVEVEALNNGHIWFEATEASMDYGAPDHVVSDWLTPDEADELAGRLIEAAATARKVKP